MSDTYKLLFRGEVLEGQHPAVVRKRLAEAADFSEAALDKLFSGKPVVVKREADTATAARFQALFKKAGARLRVLPVETEDEMAQGGRDARAVPAAGASEGGAERSEAPSGSSSGDLELLPAGSSVLREDERAPWQPRDIDTGDLSLEGARFLVHEDAPAPEAPDVSHLSVAEAGSDLGPGQALPEHPVQAPDLDIAAAGEDLAPRRAPGPPAVDFSALSFDVAPAGSDLDQRESLPPPPVPDTSHLDLSDPG